jgi:hypothetical protein
MHSFSVRCSQTERVGASLVRITSNRDRACLIALSRRRLAPEGGPIPFQPNHVGMPTSVRDASRVATVANLHSSSRRQPSTATRYRRSSHATPRRSTHVFTSSIYSKLRIKALLTVFCKMSETSKKTIFDLSDETLARIFSFVIDDRRTWSSLRWTCKRFCQVINQKVLIHPDCPSYELKEQNCAQCFKIFTITLFKHVKFNRFYMELPLHRCCLNMAETLKQHLETIRELILIKAHYNLVTLSSLLNIMKNVNRLCIDCSTSKECFGAVKYAELPKPFNRTLSYLHIAYSCSPSQIDAESILLNFPSTDFHVMYLPHDRLTWSETYLFKHQEVVKHFEISFETLNRSKDREFVNSLKSLGFQVHYTYSCEYKNGRRTSKVKGFK